MTEALARFFRWNNSKLIGSRSVIFEKFLKVFFFLSVVVYRRAAPQPGAPSQRVIVHNFDSDLHMHVDRGRAMGSAIYWTGFHEFKEFLFLHRFLKADMTFVDVGANLGEYSLFAAKRLTSGRVLAFEPLPSMQEILRENIALNGLRNIEVFPIGLSSRSETLTIHEFEEAHEGLATFYPGERTSKPSINVPMRTLDEVIGSLGLKRVDFVKMDIEGGELKALQGCRSVIEQFHPVFLVEINEETYRAAGYTVEDVVTFFNEVGYKPYQIVKRGFTQEALRLPAFCNALFIKQ
jgi:FkbM family methyltransferase